MNDPWIGAGGVAQNLPLVSRDRHFDLVPRLLLAAPQVLAPRSSLETHRVGCYADRFGSCAVHGA